MCIRDRDCRTTLLLFIVMPKLKTKSGAKKRFRKTSTGKIVIKKSSMRHGMTKRSKKMKLKARKSSIMSKADMKIVDNFIPYT